MATTTRISLPVRNVRFAEFCLADRRAASGRTRTVGGRGPIPTLLRHPGLTASAYPVKLELREPFIVDRSQINSGQTAKPMGMGKSHWRRRIALLRRRAAAGDIAAALDLALDLLDGIQDRQGHSVIRRNSPFAVRLLQYAADNGKSSAAAMLACAYDVGKGVRRNDRVAIRWYHRAVRQGESLAAANLATVYRDKGNLRRAHHWHLRAMEMGDGDAAVDTGYDYLYGIGVRKDLRLARRMFQNALQSTDISQLGREEAGFLVLLGAGAIVALVGPLLYVATGWPGLLPRPYGLILTASYLVPVALLFIGYHRAGSADRARLRWMLWGGGLFAVGILALDTAAFGPASLIASEFAQSLGLAAFLYAILRHRVVEIKVVISRTLVYAMTTSLVLGLFALFESLLERTAIGHSASLALELAVPLGLGVSLSTVHRRIDTLVDRLIFRHQYREEMALRRFAKESAFVSQAETLLDLTVEHILLHVGAPWVAFYEYGSDGYRRVRQRGEKDLPQAVATDDLALVKLRAHDSDVDLQEAPSGLGREGYAFPLRARDHLLGVLVVGPRPGEHYAAEERELIANVAHAVGASLFALRARASEVLLSESRARESALLDALRALGAAPRVSGER